jgi:hypothetical protein
MTPAATPAPFPVPWSETQAGRAEDWVKKYVLEVQSSVDFHGAVEYMGGKKAAQLMRAEERR